MAENTREIVLDLLLEMEKSAYDAPGLLKAVLDKYDYLDGAEKKFIKRLSEGVLERRIELDYVLDACSTTPVKKMKPLIRNLLRMGAYQILFMDGVPDRAACNEAVKLAGKRKFTGLKGFVNGVLRKIATVGSSIPYPMEDEEPLKALSIRYSMPEWIVSLWLSEYGFEKTKGILEGLLSIHPVTIRFLRDVSEEKREKLLRCWEKHGVRIMPCKSLPGSYQLEGLEGVTALEGFAEGLFTVQDVSSGIALEAAEIRKEDVVVDVCAAPGGKTLYALERAEKVFSSDLTEKKVERIYENLNRFALAKQAQISVWDATVTNDSFAEKADLLILDVPCSGFGVMGKKREIKYRVKPEDLSELQKLQKRIVTASMPYVKKGGRILYSTCTIDRKENEEMAEWIGKSFPVEMVVERQLLPGEYEGDGFYYAVFVKHSS